MAAKGNLFRYIGFVFLYGTIAFTACTFAQDQKSEVANTDTKEILQPYLGKWRPTSFREGLNISSLTITEAGLSLENGSSLTYKIIKKSEEGVIVSITGRKPESAFRGVKALMFSLETHEIKSFPSGGPTKQRLDLWIYWCGSVDQLVLKLSGASCSKNGYMR